MSNYQTTPFVRGQNARRSLNSYPRSSSALLSGGKSTDALRTNEAAGYGTHEKRPVAGQGDTKGAVSRYSAVPANVKKKNPKEQGMALDPNQNGWNSPQDLHYKQQMRLGFMDWRNSYSEKARPRYSPQRDYRPPAPTHNWTNQHNLRTQETSLHQHRDIKPYSSPKTLNKNNLNGTLYRSNSSLALDKSSHPHPVQDMLLHREYGSTTSLDIINDQQGLQGDTDEGFFSIVKAYRNQDKDQRAPAPSQFQDILQPQHRSEIQMQLVKADRDVSDSPSSSGTLDDTTASPHTKSRPYKSKEQKPRPKSSNADSSGGFIRKILGKSESNYGELKLEAGIDADSGKSAEEKHRQKAFIHYDTQSIGINFSAFALKRINSDQQQKQKTATGASAASLVSAFTNAEGEDVGDAKSNALVQSCPYFRNELGGEEEWCITLNRHTAQKRYQQLIGADVSVTTVRQPMCNGVSVLDQSLSPLGRWAPAVLVTKGGLVIEYVDHGAQYYREFFHTRDHQNYFGIDENLGPVAVSFKREFVRAEGSHIRQHQRKEEEGGAQTGWHQYRLIVRCSELPTLRGCVLEDAVPTVRQLSANRGLPAKDVIEFVTPEINWQCLRLAAGDTEGERAVEQLLKLDEQGVTKQYKVGIMYCKAGQTTEDEMYSNEISGPALEEFLDCIGTKVRLKGFDKYKGGLDYKSDSTGLHSYHTDFLEYELMFHVSTLLPFSPTNTQQLLRKRHIGNDIVTIVFQEPGCLPFSPKSVRSQFQHVFIIVRVHHPNTSKTCYSLAVSRSKDVPVFGPPLPDQAVFKKGEEFKHYLLTKVINAENAVHHSEKFMSMARRTREEYLKILATSHVSSTPIETGSRLSLFLSGKKKKDKSQALPESCARGAVVWNVQVDDFGQDNRLECFLGISMSMLVLLEEKKREVVFTCPCKSVIGWTCHGNSLRLYYDRGEYISMRTVYPGSEDLLEIMHRLQAVTPGAKTEEFKLSRNSNNQLGLHVQHEGVVSVVEPASPAQRAGIKQGSRIVEVCDEVVASLTHQQMVDLLRSSADVKVVVIPPNREGLVRRGEDEMKSSHRAFLTTHTIPQPEVLSQSTDLNNQSKNTPSSRSGSYLVPETSVRPPEIYGAANYVDFAAVDTSVIKNKQVAGIKHQYQNSYDSTCSKSSGHGSDAPPSIEFRNETRMDTLSSEGFGSGGESLDRQRRQQQPGALQLLPPQPSTSANYLSLNALLSPNMPADAPSPWQQFTPQQPSPSHSSPPADLSPSALGYSNLAPRPYAKPKEYSPTWTGVGQMGFTPEEQVTGEILQFSREPRKISPAAVARHLSREDLRKTGGQQHTVKFDHSPHGSDSSRGSRGRGRGNTSDKGSTRTLTSTSSRTTKSAVDENLKRLINLDVSFNEDEAPMDRPPTSSTSYGHHLDQLQDLPPSVAVHRTKSEESLVSPSLARRFPHHYGQYWIERRKDDMGRSDANFASAGPSHSATTSRQFRQAPPAEDTSYAQAQSSSPDVNQLLHQLEQERREKEELRRELALMKEQSRRAASDVKRLNNFFF